jgi:DNA-binding response OmpR family regulator
LDINLPKYNGDVVLQHVRRQPSLNRVPVIVLTSSPSPADRAAALELGANLYLQKSSDLSQLLDMGRIIEGVLAKGTAAEPSHPSSV